MLCYTSYRQTFALFQVVECHVVSEDPIQEQRNPGEDELAMCTIGAEWLCRKTYSICNPQSPSIFLALLQTPWMWFDHDRSDDMKSPKYLYIVTVSRIETFSIISVQGDNGDLFWEMCITLHLDSLNVIKLELAQVCMIYIYHSAEMQSHHQMTQADIRVYFVSIKHNLWAHRDVKVCQVININQE